MELNVRFKTSESDVLPYLSNNTLRGSWAASSWATSDLSSSAACTVPMIRLTATREQLRLALLFNLEKHASHLSRIRHHQRMRTIYFEIPASDSVFQR